MSEIKPIEEAVRCWIEAWSNRDKDGVLSVWDDQDSEATYLPAEREDALIGVAAVEHYVTALCDQFSTIHHRPNSIIIKRLADDVALVFYVLDWAVSDDRGPIGGRCRVTAVWRNRDADWKLTHYAESPLAPLVELKEFYQHVAAQGLPA